MKIGNLDILTRCWSQQKTGIRFTGTWVVLAWHWKKSVTWRWALYYKFPFHIELKTQKNQWWRK